jgi:type IV pilus assembly protein PilE
MYKQYGFTLIELMIVTAVIGILAAIALPSYSAYVFRSRIPASLDALTAYQARMEQTFQDTSSYARTADSNVCASSLPTATSTFSLSCTTNNEGQGYTATVVGIGALAGVSYSINEVGTRITLSHPYGVPISNCWSIRGGTCDS